MADTTDAGSNLQELDIAKQMTLKIKQRTTSDYTTLTKEPPEVEDLYFVVHYKLE
jgi:hypothetical protein